MTRMMAKKKNSRVTRRTTPRVAPNASADGRDLDGWPRSWMGVEKDGPPGEELVACFRPFIEHLASSRLSQKTIRRHVDNLWVLGGEIIRDLNDEPSLRRRPADRLLSKVIHEDGGPLLYSGSEKEQRSFDATCRKLHRFRTQPQPSATQLPTDSPDEANK
jgi:hypothetical protein